MSEAPWGRGLPPRKRGYAHIRRLLGVRRNQDVRLDFCEQGMVCDEGGKIVWNCWQDGPVVRVGTASQALVLPFPHALVDDPDVDLWRLIELSVEQQWAAFRKPVTDTPRL